MTELSASRSELDRKWNPEPGIFAKDFNGYQSTRDYPLFPNPHSPILLCRLAHCSPPRAGKSLGIEERTTVVITPPTDAEQLRTVIRF